MQGNALLFPGIILICESLSTQSSSYVTAEYLISGRFLHNTVARKTFTLRRLELIWIISEDQHGPPLVTGAAY